MEGINSWCHHGQGNEAAVSTDRNRTGRLRVGRACGFRVGVECIKQASFELPSQTVNISKELKVSMSTEFDLVHFVVHRLPWRSPTQFSTAFRDSGFPCFWCWYHSSLGESGQLPHHSAHYSWLKVHELVQEMQQKQKNVSI